ncbi:hypothetical protein P9600_gp11 [Escherichia phage vB_EcoD_Opt212]|uniref:Uncharacterized protein n=1 Tax=Escherichia phage vB_EcoD_Opt212 TaxID=2906743 RepID=A0AAE9CH42_9CAUD|nr:hypothetical protein P9600_gp11 [Escherichia phage vB_EcoD_Opt212]UHS64792.1 hypothetical protein OPT212_11 [Escherichia phage vB_EcoD_Opt212]
MWLLSKRTGRHAITHIWRSYPVSAVIRDMLMHNLFEIGGRVFRNYFVARAWARHIGKPEGAIRCYTI